jgi:HSP20 family protein
LIWIKAGVRAAVDSEHWQPRRGYSGDRNMVTNADHLNTLMTLQRALERSFDSDWLRGSTAGTGSFPPINIFQQGEDFVAIAELPGVSKTDIEIQVQDKAIRISGRKTVQLRRECERSSPGKVVGRLRPHDYPPGAGRRGPPEG